jgi:glycosyltransferase involved in cell wall biosynthesis
VLIISLNYLPSHGTGSNRIISFINSLNKNIFDIIILTFNSKLNKNDDFQQIYNQPIKIINFNNYFPLFKGSHLIYQGLFLPDDYFGWILTTLLNIKKFKDIDIIFCTYIPKSSIIIGALLKKILKKTLIIDFRDSWTNNPYIKYPTILHKKYDELLEQLVIKMADIITVSTKTIYNEYNKKYSFLKNRIYYLPNGFDEKKLPLNKPTKFNKFTIIYTGSFYGSRQPYVFYQALINLSKSNKEIFNDINVVFIGALGSNNINFIENSILKKIIQIYDVLPYDTTLEYILKSHLLLLIEYTNSVTTKVYDYIICDGPILALINKGELYDLLNKYSNICNIVTTNDVSYVESIILKEYTDYKNNVKKNNDPILYKNFKHTYDRVIIGKKFSKLVHYVLLRKA